MARVKKALNAKKKHKDIKACKGILWCKSKLYRPANEAVMSFEISLYWKKIKKEILGNYGSQELMQQQEQMAYPTVDLLMV